MEERVEKGLQKKPRLVPHKHAHAEISLWSLPTSGETVFFSNSLAFSMSRRESNHCTSCRTALSFKVRTLHGDKADHDANALTGYRL